jgi:hypothetical protein
MLICPVLVIIMLLQFIEGQVVPIFLILIVAELADGSIVVNPSGIENFIVKSLLLPEDN